MDFEQFLREANTKPDYNTNAGSYYKDLARKQELIKLLAKRIWEYEELLDTTLENISSRLESYINENDTLMSERLKNWDDRIENLDEEVSHIFIEWMNDGTLAEIIHNDVLAYKADKADLDNVKEQLTQKANITYVDSLLLDVVKDGGPKGLFNSINTLKTTYPNGTDGTFLVMDSTFTDGAHAFIWNGSMWSDLGLYQSNFIEDYSITASKIDLNSIPLSRIKGELINSNMFDKNEALIGKGLNYVDGTVVTLEDSFVSEFIPVSPLSNYLFSASSPRWEYDLNKNPIRSLTTLQFSTSENARYVRFASPISNLNSAYLRHLSAEAPYTDFKKKIPGLVSDNPPVDYHGFYFGNASSMDFDFKTKKIKILANAGVAHRNKRYLTVDQEVVIPESPNFHFVYYNTLNGLVGTTPSTSTIKNDHIVIGVMSVNEEKVYNIDNCYINGRPRENTVVKYVPELSFDKYYKSNHVFEGVEALRTYKTTDFYSLYDNNILSNNSGYVSKTVISTSPEGTPINAYRFKPEKPLLKDPHGYALNKTPKVIITTGTHGEHTAIYTLYKAMEQIANNWTSSEELEALRFNVEFLIVPCVTPYAIDNNQRKNGNSVDINRNFPSGWWLNPDTTSQEYGGTSALSEIESQAINNVFETEKDVLAVIDFHNFYDGSQTEGNFLWGLSDNNETLSLLQSVIGRMTRKGSIDYPFVNPQIPVGYVSPSMAGSVSRHASNKYKVPHGMTFEICDTLTSDSEGQSNDQKVIEYAHNSFINLLLMTLNSIL